MVPTSVRQNKNRDSARSRSAPSDQRTLSCRIRNTAGFFSVERGTGRLGRAVCAPMRPRASAVSEVTATDALAVLTPIWHDKPETARRVRQRIGAGVRVPGPDGGAIRRSAPGDVGRNGPGRGVWTIPAGRIKATPSGSPRPTFGAGACDPARRTETERWHRPGVPQSAWEAALRRNAEPADQRTRHRRRAAWVPVELPADERRGSRRGMKNPSIIGNLEPQTRIYRIFPRVRFFELFKEQRNALVQPRKWQDPFENIFLNSSVKAVNGDILSFSLHDAVTGSAGLATTHRMRCGKSTPKMATEYVSEQQLGS